MTVQLRIISYNTPNLRKVYGILKVRDLSYRLNFVYENLLFHEILLQ